MKKELTHELRDALSEIDFLNGLLPICTFCKKIKDRSGIWERIESYISKRSEAKFTHGVCPECAKKHYGNILEPEETWS